MSPPCCFPRPLCFGALLVWFRLFSHISESQCCSQEYMDCRDPYLFRCGAKQFNVSYPFMAPGRKEHCGVREHYNLICNDEYDPVVVVGGRPFRVIHIDYVSGILTIADVLAGSEDKRCPPALFPDVTVEPRFFEYIDDYLSLTTLYRNCTRVPGLFPHLYDVPCLALPPKHSYIVNPNKPPPEPLASQVEKGCESTTTVPLGRTAARFLNFSDLDESMWKAAREGFNLTWASSKWCRECRDSGGVCGYNRRNELQPRICFNCSDSCPSSSAPRDKKKKKAAIGVGAGVGGFLLSSLLCFILYRRKRVKARAVSSTLLFPSTSSDFSSRKDLEMAGSVHYPTHLFKYEELSEATDGFNEANELGDGGFGTVYKGKLRDGRIVAVKRLYENNYKRVEQFMNEVVILNRLQHPNLVSLYGCTSRHSRGLLLVYEYVPNGTVADHLHGDRAPEGLLSWSVRLNIAIETATALAYLHKVEPQIIHRDVKTNNILLDHDFHVKVADFGLSRLFPMDATHVSTAPQGTPGYVDPEYHQCYQLTDKSDVYSFGVVLVELISSMPAVDITRHRHDINLANMAMSKIQNGALHELVDPTLGFDTNWEVRRMINLVAELAFRCLQAEREMRPSMEDVVEALLGIRGDTAMGDMDQAAVRDDQSLLKHKVPFSPDSVMDKWASRMTTPNTSA